jgi:hypothetical protein
MKGSLLLSNIYRSVRLPVDIECKALEVNNNNVYFKNNTKQLLRLGRSISSNFVDNSSHWSPKTRNQIYSGAVNHLEFKSDEYYPDTTPKSKYCFIRFLEVIKAVSPREKSTNDRFENKRKSELKLANKFNSRHLSAYQPW